MARQRPFGHSNRLSVIGTKQRPRTIAPGSQRAVARSKVPIGYQSGQVLQCLPHTWDLVLGRHKGKRTKHACQQLKFSQVCHHTHTGFNDRSDKQRRLNIRSRLRKDTQFMSYKNQTTDAGKNADSGTNKSFCLQSLPYRLFPYGYMP